MNISNPPPAPKGQCEVLEEGDPATIAGAFHNMGLSRPPVPAVSANQRKFYEQKERVEDLLFKRRVFGPAAFQ